MGSIRTFPGERLVEAIDSGTDAARRHFERLASPGNGSAAIEAVDEPTGHVPASNILSPSTADVELNEIPGFLCTGPDPPTEH
ncbi:MAG: hypothetical protein U9R74_15155 [Pseudomonadota bacterium]|nr:hypothetical protein [Pseudomonadota bacterium]